MSYSTINGMRSHRYPLMGGSDVLSGGCGCGCAGGCADAGTASLGSNVAAGVLGSLAGIGAFSAFVLGTAWFFTRD